MGNPDHGTTYMRVRGDDGELRPWHFIYVYSIENRLMLHACLEADDECLEGGKGARSPFVPTAVVWASAPGGVFHPSRSCQGNISRVYKHTGHAQQKCVDAPALI
jgi:hypothetical protein